MMGRAERETVSYFAVFVAFGNHLGFTCLPSELATVIALGIPKSELVRQHL